MFLTHTFWTVSHPDFLDLDVLHPYLDILYRKISDLDDVSPPDILDQDVSPPNVLDPDVFTS